jgi:hypothetical protein
MRFKSITISTLFIFTFYLHASPARAFEWSDLNPKKLVDKVVNGADKFVKAHDITDKNSPGRRFLRGLDITNPNSETCTIAKKGGNEAASIAASAGPKGVAAASAIVFIQKTCANAAQGKVINPEEADVDMAVAYQTQFAIEKARLENKLEIVRLLENSKIEIEKHRQNGETKRVELVQENLLRIALSNNETEIKLGEQNLRAIESNNWSVVEVQRIKKDTTLIETGITVLSNLFGGNPQVQVARIEAETERKRIDNERLRIELEVKKQELEAKKQEQEQPRVVQDPNIVLLQSWGLASVSCSTSTASIDISGRQYCANATDKLVAGRYAYNSSSRRLQRVDPLPVPSQPSDPNVALLQSWGLAITSCNASDTFIYMDNQRYCTIASGKFQKGQYVYDRAANRLRRAESSSPRSSSGFN